MTFLLKRLLKWSLPKNDVIIKGLYNMYYTYKRVIECPNSIEVEFYKSIREVGKNYGGRGVNRKLTPAKQKIANEIRTTRKWERLIDCNFCERDFFCRFSAPYGTFTSEKQFRNEVRNWMTRIKRRLKGERELKYIGFCECGKSGKNWHLHIILEREVAEIAAKCWHYRNGGVNFTPLWENHNYEKLADYIHKDLSPTKEDKEDEFAMQQTAKKRMMASRNLLRPIVKVRRATRKEIRRLEKGMELDPPKEGFYPVKDEMAKVINDVTGASWFFRFNRIAYRTWEN